MNIFIERSIRGALDFFKEAVFSEEIAKKKGLMQTAGPKVKIIFLLGALLAACLVRNIPPLLIIYALSLALSAASGINILFFIKRAWFFIPIFALFIAIPAVFTQGMYSAAIFVLRVATCVSFVVLVTLTTSRSRILRSLNSLGVPDIFIQVLDMTYRYIFLFIGIFEDMHTALKSRLIKKFDPARARRWISSRVSYLFKKSVRMSEDVYLAMLARGYTGDYKRYDK